MRDTRCRMEPPPSCKERGSDCEWPGRERSIGKLHRHQILLFSPLTVSFHVSICLTETRVSVAKRVDIRQWAVLGAERRLEEIAEETAAIRRAFPELRGRAGRSTNSDGSAERAPRKRRRKMSAEARKRISDAQKARWAKQRAGEGGTKKK
jgi:hypothetical protein